MSSFNSKMKIKSLLTVTGTAATFFSGICLYQGNEKFYKDIAIPFMQLIDSEVAHNIAIKMLKWGIIPEQREKDPKSLETTVWGLNFNSPIGMAAGFDKQGEAVKGLHKLGFGFVEIGSVTPKPQPGNPKPRVFRLPEDIAIINRYGFNSNGHELVWERIKKIKDENFTGIIGINLGKNKDSNDGVQDYIDGIVKFRDVADYFVINISSPNTPGLRTLQNKTNLKELLIKVNNTRKSINSNQPLLLKLAPDLTESERQDIADVIMDKHSRVDGLVLCNTTVSRTNLVNANKNELGGLSGAPLTNLSTEMISDMYKRTHGTIPIIGVGGIFSGKDAYDKIKAGATLVQLYTSFIYHGPPIITKIKKELNEILKNNNEMCISDVVGKGTKTS